MDDRNCASCIHVDVCAMVKTDLPVCDSYKDKDSYKQVVHGRWIQKPYNVVCVNLIDFVCDQCGRREHRPEPYCHCGAKMDLEE